MLTKKSDSAIDPNSPYVDVIRVLMGPKRPSKHWGDLKKKLIDEEGFSELSEKIGQLRMPGFDGKRYLTDAADTETIFRIVQSIPSKKAEPFKKWLAKVGYDRQKTKRNNPKVQVINLGLGWGAFGALDLKTNPVLP